MKKITFSIILIAFASLIFAAAPTVTNLVVNPQTGHVMITYDLTADTACDVELRISADSQSFTIIPTAVAGDVSNVSPGVAKQIIWYPAADGMELGDNYKAMLIATDTQTTESGGFVLVPGGTYIRGSGEDAHNVTLAPFYIGKYEVTRAEYYALMDTGTHNPPYYGPDDNCPAYRASWYDTLVYCNERSMNEGLTPCYTINGSTNPADWSSLNYSVWNLALCNWAANGYRLPTEAEWEYAARGASNDPDYTYSGSNTIDDVAWYSGNSGGTTHIVGTKAPNALGLFDMNGNLREWCWDWWGSSTLWGNSENPTGPDSGSNRVHRGGHWNNGASFCTVAKRASDLPYSRDTDIGFRICRSNNSK